MAQLGCDPEPIETIPRLLPFGCYTYNIQMAKDGEAGHAAFYFGGR